MSRIETQADLIASAITKCCGQQCVAEILNALLSAECNPALSDAEAESAQLLFDKLADANPKAVLLAQSM